MSTQPTRRILATSANLSIILGGIYYTAALVTYAFRHPELTGTQQLLAFWEVITWQ